MTPPLLHELDSARVARASVAGAGESRCAAVAGVGTESGDGGWRGARPPPPSAPGKRMSPGPFRMAPGKGRGPQIFRSLASTARGSGEMAWMCMARGKVSARGRGCIAQGCAASLHAFDARSSWSPQGGGAMPRQPEKGHESSRGEGKGSLYVSAGCLTYRFSVENAASSRGLRAWRRWPT